ncbi:MAG: heparinase II/III family protein [Sneathiella sp.]|nr:heparinase II/III family protein [Sneathiella sp.]
MSKTAIMPAKEGLPSRRSVSDVIFSSGAYQASLKCRVPKRLALAPADIFPGDGERADNIFQGQFDFAGFSIELGNQEPWQALGMPLAWHKELHEFGWLRDFAANGSEAARRHARALIQSWIAGFDIYHPYIWDEEVLARRLIAWFCHSDFLLEKEESDFSFLRSLRRQYVHLSRISKTKPRTEDKVQTWQALLYGALGFADMRKNCDRLLTSLEAELNRVVLADGCHISRNPERHLTLLGDLLGLRNTLMAASEMVPVAINNAIDRLAPAIRFFQHGDGCLALFNGGMRLKEGQCDNLLSLSDATGRPPHRFPQGGFERLKAGRALLILESGEGGRDKQDLRHSGLLSFEFSYGRERLIVNCGAVRDLTSSWGKALAATAAHSTLSFNNLNAVFPERSSGDSQHNPVVRNEEDGNIWLDLESEGYLMSIGALHRRRLYLDASGLALRGEDQIIPERMPPSGRSHFTIRFHLHPDLSISRSAGGKNILIRTPSGTGWKFLTGAPTLSLEESVYCSEPGERRRNQQIVINGQLIDQEPILIKWALTRLSD